MNRAITPPSSRRVQSQRSTLSVVIVYEDQATRDRAMATCDYLVKRHWSDFEFDFSWWKFAYLRDSAIAAAAASAASEANMIIFSAQLGKELPPVVRGWVEKWASRREKDRGALVALIGTPEDALTPTHYYLRNVAVRSHMDFLPPASAGQRGCASEIDHALDCSPSSLST